jgi:hypothetical protein
LSSPDILQNLLLSCTTCTQPRNNAVLECLLVTPIIGLVAQLWGIFHADPIANRYGVKYLQNLRQDQQ